MGVHASLEVYSQIKELLDIPDDEPIIVFRAQDKFARSLTRHYRTLVMSDKPLRDPEAEDWFLNIDSKIQEFIDWQKNNQDKVKVPD